MKRFEIGNSVIEFSRSQDAYREIRQKYKKISEGVRQDFEDRYSTIFNDLEGIPQKLEIVASDYLARMGRIVISDLIEAEIPYIDDELFLEYHNRRYLALGRHAPVLPSAYRASTEGDDDGDGVGRPSLTGGGFGIEGAAQGIAIAAAANAAIGLASGILGGAANALKSAEARTRLKHLINDEGTKKELAQSIFDMAFKTHFTLVDLVNKHSQSVEIQQPHENDKRRSKAIVNNVNEGRVPESAVEKYLADAIRDDPYNGNAYAAWKENVVARSKGFEDLAAYVGISTATLSNNGEGSIGVSKSIKTTKAERDGFLSILGSYESKDFFVFDQIPEHKKNNAIQYYFNPANVLGDQSGEITDPSKLLALIDGTLLGSAEYGIAISEHGVYWNSDKGPSCLSWGEIVKNDLNIEGGIFGFKFGDKKFQMASQMKSSMVVGVIKDCIGYYKSLRSLT